MNLEGSLRETQWGSCAAWGEEVCGHTEKVLAVKGQRGAL